jgi:hypothetical protein
MRHNRGGRYFEAAGGALVGRLKKGRFSRATTIVLLIAATVVFGAGRRASAATSADRLLYSPDDRDKPIPVAIALEIENIPQIDEVAEQFSVDGDLLATWNDPRLAYQPASPSDPDKIYQIGSIWMPSFDMINSAVPRDKRYQSLTVAPDGTVHYAERFHARLSSRFMLRRFPFDEQSLTIHISPFINNISGETLNIAPGESAVHGDAKSYNSLAQWEVGSISARTGSFRQFKKNATELVFSIEVKRHYGFYIWKVFLPLLLMVFLSWAVFWVDPFDLSNQVQIAVTTILTVIAFAFAISATMPRVPYITFIDAFFLTCYVFVFIAVVELITVHTTHRRHGPDASKRIRRVSRWLVPAAYFTTLAILSADFLR